MRSRISSIIAKSTQTQEVFGGDYEQQLQQLQRLLQQVEHERDTYRAQVGDAQAFQQQAQQSSQREQELQRMLNREKELLTAEQRKVEALTGEKLDVEKNAEAIDKRNKEDYTKQRQLFNDLEQRVEENASLRARIQTLEAELDKYKRKGDELSVETARVPDLLQEIELRKRESAGFKSRIRVKS